MSKHADRLATVLFIAAASLYIWKQIPGGRPPRRLDPSKLVGKTLSALPTQRPGGALVMVVQTTCHYCSESKAFYAKLWAAKRPDLRLVAVLPQSLEESGAYLANVPVDEVVSEKLGTLGLGSPSDLFPTPTLMLIDSQRKVKRVWVGKLDERSEAEVLKAIGAAGTGYDQGQSASRKLKESNDDLAQIVVPGHCGATADRPSFRASQAKSEAH